MSQYRNFLKNLVLNLNCSDVDLMIGLQWAKKNSLPQDIICNIFRYGFENSCNYYFFQEMQQHPFLPKNFEFFCIDDYICGLNPVFGNTWPIFFISSINNSNLALSLVREELKKASIIKSIENCFSKGKLYFVNYSPINLNQKYFQVKLEKSQFLVNIFRDFPDKPFCKVCVLDTFWFEFQSREIVNALYSQEFKRLFIEFADHIVEIYQLTDALLSDKNTQSSAYSMQNEIPIAIIKPPFSYKKSSYFSLFCLDEKGNLFFRLYNHVVQDRKYLQYKNSLFSIEKKQDNSLIKIKKNYNNADQKYSVLKLVGIMVTMIALISLDFEKLYASL